MKQVTIFAQGTAEGDPGPAAIGVRMADSDGKVLEEISEKIGNATNNFSGYQAVLRALQTAEEKFGEKTKEIKFEVKLDNELVKRQLNGEEQIIDPGLVPFFIAIHNLKVANFPNLAFTQVRGEQNKEVNRLVNKVLDS